MDVRPLGVRHSLVRLFHREVIAQNKQEIIEYLEPIQLGQSKAGASKLVRSVQGMLQQNPGWVCVQTDVKNCHNSLSRRAVLDEVVNTPTLNHMATFAATILAPEPALEAEGKAWGKTGTGVVQGDPVSGAFQAVGFQPSVRRLDEECAVGGGAARAGADDVFSCGPPEVVLPAVQRFAEEIKERCGLTLQWRKSRVFCWQGEVPPYASPGLTLAGEQVGETFLRGMMVYGVPVGTPEYVTFKLKEVAARIVKDADKTREVLKGDGQALWSVLRLSIAQKFGYLQQLTPPSLCRPVAAELDAALWRILETAAGFSIPRGDEKGGLVVRTPAVLSLDGKSFQEWAVRLPARLYGWGFRSLEDSCGPA